MSERCVAPTERAAVFSAVCVALAAGAHGLMGHRGVPLWAYPVGLVAVFGFARAATTRECGPLMIYGLMGGAQAGLHLLFSAAQQAATGHPGGRVVVGGMPGMAHGHPMTTASGMGHFSGGMLLGHAVASLVLAWWLRCGEAAVFALARALRLKIAAVCALLLAPGAAITPLVVSSAYQMVSEVLGGARQAIRFAVVRRGPPEAGVLV